MPSGAFHRRPMRAASCLRRGRCRRIRRSQRKRSTAWLGAWGSNTAAAFARSAGSNGAARVPGLPISIPPRSTSRPIPTCCIPPCLMAHCRACSDCWPIITISCKGSPFCPGASAGCGCWRRSRACPSAPNCGSRASESARFPPTSRSMTRPGTPSPSSLSAGSAGLSSTCVLQLTIAPCGSISFRLRSTKKGPPRCWHGSAPPCPGSPPPVRAARRSRSRRFCSTRWSARSLSPPCASSPGRRTPLRSMISSRRDVSIRLRPGWSNVCCACSSGSAPPARLRRCGGLIRGAICPRRARCGGCCSPMRRIWWWSLRLPPLRPRPCRKSSPASAAGIDLLCAVLGEIAAAWPRGRPLRLLELGAGGGATRRLLECLTQAGIPFSYLATTADAEQASRLSFLTDAFAGAAACQWSPQDGNAPLAGATFDIVLAANACARLRLDTAAFAGLCELLSPGGLFLAVEPEPNALWDLAFGQNPAWWQPASRGAVSPLRLGEEWRAELAAAGFVDAAAAPTVLAPWPCAVFWGTAPAREAAAPASPAPRGALTIVAAAGDFATALAEGLAGLGYRVELSSDYDPTVAAAEGAAPELVLFVAEQPEKGDAVVASARQLAAFARVAAKAAERHAALWLLTCDAQQATSAADGSVGAALWGLGRALINEMPRLSLRLVDFAAATAADERVRQLARELLADSPESEIVWTPEGRHVLRLRWGLPPRWASASDVLALSSSHPGGLGSLGWEVRPPHPVGPGEVEIEVAAAALNFRDMMWAMGLLPEEALIDGFAGATFGLECAGTVRALGPGVSGLAIGDRVMALAPASLGTRVVTRAEAVTPIPPAISFAAAATIPVTFVTVVYALGHLARLMPGEYVLIHAASGGVGLSAIQYAKHRGAIVIATAGSEVKRAFLRLAGADHVLNSRDLAFADAVREITGGRGVDVVLNSLSGEAMEQSLMVLKPFGRFLELGKSDFYLNRRIHLRPLRQNISYFAINVDQLPIHRPDLARALLS